MYRHIQKLHTNPLYAIAFLVLVAWLSGDAAWLGADGIIYVVVGAGVIVVATPILLGKMKRHCIAMVSGRGPSKLDWVSAPSGYRRARYVESEEEAAAQSIVIPTPNRPLIAERHDTEFHRSETEKIPVAALLSHQEAVESHPVLRASQMRQSIVPVGGYKSLDRRGPVQEELSLDPRFPAPQDMARIIERGFKPARDRILLMATATGYATEKISHLHHVGLAGASGKGKTNVTRMIVSQLLACDAKVYMINPNFAPVKHNGNRLEDWRPIASRLQTAVARNPPEIKALLSHFMQIFKERREREQVTPKRGADLFLVLGEWPVIVEEYPEAANIIGRLLRQSRQYGIHVIAEFQDALIATIKGNSGTRENYGTAYFFGGDPTTAKTLLKLPDGVRIDQNGLGDKGAVYLKSFSGPATTGRVPFFSNLALYMLLGFPEDPVTDEEVDEDEFYEDESGDFEHDEEENVIESESLNLSQGVLNDFHPIPTHSQPILTPILPEKGRQAEDIDINAAISVYNIGKTSRYELAKVFGLSESQGRKLKEIIEERAKQIGG